jgi:hypothetical protein
MQRVHRFPLNDVIPLTMSRSGMACPGRAEGAWRRHSRSEPKLLVIESFTAAHSLISQDSG